MWKQTIGFKFYQKIHYDKELENSPAPAEHYYFSDEIFANIISQCRN